MDAFGLCVASENGGQEDHLDPRGERWRSVSRFELDPKNSGEAPGAWDRAFDRDGNGSRARPPKLQGKCPVIYAPFDLSWVVRKYVAILDPVLYISAETEIWPNLFTCLHKRNVPIVEVNGRISDKAFAGYRKVYFLTRRVLRGVRLLCMQSQGGRAVDHCAGRG